MTRKTKETPIPADLMAMGLADLQRLQGQRGGNREEFHRLVQARDKAQAELDMYLQRNHDIERALTVKLQEAIEAQKAR